MLHALESFFAPGRDIVKGQDVDPSDPVVRGREHLFTADDTPAPAKPAPTARKAPAKKSAAKS